MNLIGALEAEKLMKQKWKQYCGTAGMSTFLEIHKYIFTKLYQIKHNFFFANWTFLTKNKRDLTQFTF